MARIIQMEKLRRRFPAAVHLAGGGHPHGVAAPARIGAVARERPVHGLGHG